MNMAEETNAGSGVVQPLPSRQSDLIGELNPLQHPQAVEKYLKRRQSFMASDNAMQGAGFCYFSPLNVLAKIELGKFEVEDTLDHVIFKNGEGARFVMPSHKAQEYYLALLYALGQKCEVRLIPEAIANHLGSQKVYKSKLYNKEYVSLTERVMSLPGSRLKSMRNEMRRAADRSEFELYHPKHEAEYLRVNREWYAEAKTRHFRPYDKTSIDWLIRNWALVEQLAPDVQMAGVRDKETGLLIAFAMVCDLTDNSWHCFTRRYVRGHNVPSPNMYCWYMLAALRQPNHSNDGTADSAEIRHAKEKYTDFILKSYSIGG